MLLFVIITTIVKLFVQVVYMVLTIFAKLYTYAKDKFSTFLKV